MRSSGLVPVAARTVQGDLLNAPTLGEAVTGVSAVAHFAAAFRTPDADLFWRSNLDGTGNLIAAVQAHAPGVRLIMASTTNLNGQNGSHAGCGIDVVAPEATYPTSKLAAEQILCESRWNWAF